MVSLKRKQSGFTIVELLIVIIVIGILAALVLVTFSGVQQKARNTERTTDIKAVASHLEVYNAQNGYYPSEDNLNQNGAANAGWINTNLKGLDPASTCDPDDANVKTPPCTFAATATNNPYKYGYTASPANCDNAGNGNCTSFVLSYYPEGANAVTNVNSLSN